MVLGLRKAQPLVTAFSELFLSPVATASTFSSLFCVFRPLFQSILTVDNLDIVQKEQARTLQ